MGDGFKVNTTDKLSWFAFCMNDDDDDDISFSDGNIEAFYDGKMD